MPSPLPLFVRLNGVVRGPFTPEQLGQLAEAGAIAPETEAYATADGPAVRLQEFPASAALFSGRPGSKVEAKAFETVNGPTGHPVELRELIAFANQMPPQSGAVPVPTVPRSNDVLDIILENARVQAQYEKPLVLARRPNRRLIDYLILMTVVNGFFLGAIILCWGNSVVFGFGIGGIAVFSAAITWTMFGVMNRY
jgi:hypothetical protein